MKGYTMNEITVIGLGNYGLDELPYGIYQLLNNTAEVYVRTLKHPVIDELPDVNWQSFDAVYERHDQFAAVYDEIVELLAAKSKQGPVVYAVPGHPMVAETTTQLLLNRDDVKVTIKGGKSFIDDLFTAAGYDPNDGFQLLDATQFETNHVNIRNALVVTQVYNQIVASDLKIALMTKYPDDHPVMIVTGARGASASLCHVPLYELDHDFTESNLTSLFIPPVTDEGLNGEFSTLIGVMERLVSPDGCPWDQQQTHQTLKRYLVEESYELMAAIDADDIDNIIEELGDILLQVFFHTALGEKEALFDIKDVVTSITEKMIRRHPHVFGTETVTTVDELHRVWEDEKRKEGKEQRDFKAEKAFADVVMALYERMQQGETIENAIKEVADETR
ncbi:nucleotide pyrophosphohydrolase [Macrococcus equipercicus]|uniref:Nucleotide pyrophosphohydrolase n=2 Tax=Macrococcus equipercicus TaxID=69967 RepID=A0ABQ6R684_9STAP|nr:nucleotide pyrophosphohydrolase [Macrococcus equipercicus]